MRLQLSKLHAEEFQGMQESEETLMALSRALIELSRQAEAKACAVAHHPVGADQQQSSACQIIERDLPVTSCRDSAAAFATIALGDSAGIPTNAALVASVMTEKDTQAIGGIQGHENSLPAKKKRRTDRVFNIADYHERYIALEVLYVGWQYMGSTFQPTEERTVEGLLLAALKRSRLIAENATVESINLSRSGRTDRGVSGLGQVVALNLRSRAKLTQALPSQEDEMDYLQALNKGLPEDIRALGWTDISQDFSARFSARYREYRYFIPFNMGGMDLDSMQKAATAFLGQHDFRNFCRVDAEHIKHCVRSILDFRIEEFPGLSISGKKVAQVHIRGSAFLWHQVRCMVAILMLVGKGLEPPNIVQRMLDVDSFGNKPQYDLAHEEPLLFFSCQYLDLKFRTSKESSFANMEAVNALLDQHIARVALLQTMVEKLRRHRHMVTDPGGNVVPWQKPRRHVPLEKRGREGSLEEKLAKYGKIMLDSSIVKLAHCK